MPSSIDSSAPKSRIDRTTPISFIQSSIRRGPHGNLFIRFAFRLYTPYIFSKAFKLRQAVRKNVTVIRKGYGRQGHAVRRIGIAADSLTHHVDHPSPVFPQDKRVFKAQVADHMMLLRAS